jgi:Na+/H+-translocating membrane pyrophosphatase
LLVQTKASEIGSELVHKLEPDNVTCDKLKNPATVADKVGAALLVGLFDCSQLCVCVCARMDEHFFFRHGVLRALVCVQDAGGGVLDVAETMCLCMVAAQVMAEGDSARLSLTFMYPGCALLASLLSYFAVRCSDQGAYIGDRHISCCWGFRFGMYVTHVLVVIYTLIMTGAVYQRYPFEALRQGGGRSEGWPHWGAHLVGQFGSILLWEATSFFTSHRWFPTRSVTAAGITGPATMVVQGLGVAMISCFLPMTIIGCVVLVAHASAGQFGVAIAAMGFWSPAAFVVAANAVAPAVFGADDCLDHPATQDHRQRTVPLVMAGESLSAEYRGWSVGAAMLSSFAVLCAFKQESGMATSGTGEPFMTQGPMQGFQMLDYRDVMPTGARGSIRALESEVILEGFVASWAMTGAFSTVFVAGISTLAIGKATRNLVDETRSQLHTNREGTADPEAISGTVTFPAIAGTMLPAFYIVLFPVCVGFFAGPRALGAFAVGAILAAGPFATVLFNSGASWAKSKTAIEAEGVFNGSGSDSHLASISTARAGGALKDVSAPCMCAYIKAISIWSLMMAPTIFISPYMPFVIDCAVKRKAYESILTCMDWNKVYWAILPSIMLLVVSGMIYFLFWNRDGTSTPSPPPEPPKLVATIPSPMVTNPVIFTPGPPPIEYATGPVMVTAQPPYQTAGIRMAGVVVSPPPEPMMAAPMRPHAGLDGLVQSGYIMEGGSQYSYQP